MPNLACPDQLKQNLWEWGPGWVLLNAPQMILLYSQGREPLAWKMEYMGWKVREGSTIVGNNTGKVGYFDICLPSFGLFPKPHIVFCQLLTM